MESSRGTVSASSDSAQLRRRTRGRRAPSNALSASAQVSVPHATERNVRVGVAGLQRQGEGQPELTAR